MIDHLTDRAVRPIELTDRMTAQRGRPRHDAPTIVAHVRLTAPIYDAFCRQAITERVSLHAVLQRALVKSLPPTD